MTATYKIPDDVNEGSYPRWVVNPFVPIIAGVLTSYLIGLIWVALNGRALGLRDQRRHWMIFGLGAVAVIVLQASGIGLARAYDPPNLNALWGELLFSLAAIFAVGVFVWAAEVQQVPSSLYNRDKTSTQFWSITLGTLGGIYLASRLLEAFVFTEATILRRVLLG